MDLDTASFLVRPAERRLQRFESVRRSFSIDRSQTALQYLRVIGHMVSLEKLIPGARLRIRSLQFHVSSHWDFSKDVLTLIPMSFEVFADLQWWAARSNLLKGHPIHEPVADHLLFSDASCQGWGAHLQDLEASGLWSSVDLKFHINYLELKAVWLGLREFLTFVRGSTVVAMTDNTTVVGYIRNQGGTRSRVLAELSRDLLLWTEEHDITLRSRHVPGRLNTRADQLSRRGSLLPGEWSLHPAVCLAMWRLWDKPLVDLFATRDNHKLPLFFSPTEDPLACGVDALSQTWDGLLSYAFPPSSLIALILNKLRGSSNARLVLIAPMWPAQAWFPSLLDLLVDFPRQLPDLPRLLKQRGAFHQSLAVLRLHGWILSSESSERQAFRSQLPRECLTPSGSLLPPSISQSGRCSLVGVVQGKLIHSLLLSL